MTVPMLLALSTAVPAQRYAQAEIFDYLAPLFERTRHARAIFGRAGVAHRHMVADRDFYLQEQGTQARNERYMAHALPLGEQAIRAVEDDQWSRSDPEKYARADDMIGKLEAGIAETQAKLDKATASGDARRVKDLESELANKQAFLDMAKKAAADFG